jgi:Uma2 family endonuclease
MAVTTPPRLTAEQFFDLPEQKHTELINGEIVVNAPSRRHQRIAGWLFYQLMHHAESKPGAGEAGYEVDIPIDDDNVFVPDVWWTTPEHTVPHDVLRAPGPPDLAIEVRSPSTWRYDIGLKLTRWEAAGLPELWLVDTEADTVIVLRRSAPTAGFDIALEVGPGDVLTTPLIPGFSLDITTLFDR